MAGGVRLTESARFAVGAVPSREWDSLGEEHARHAAFRTPPREPSMGVILPSPPTANPPRARDGIAFGLDWDWYGVVLRRKRCDQQRSCIEEFGECGRAARG